MGADVFVDHGCTLDDMGGIEIGDGAVVAAAAVVTRDVPPTILVARNPARAVRTPA